MGVYLKVQLGIILLKTNKFRKFICAIIKLFLFLWRNRNYIFQRFSCGYITLNFHCNGGVSCFSNRSKPPCFLQVVMPGVPGDGWGGGWRLAKKAFKSFPHIHFFHNLFLANPWWVRSSYTQHRYVYIFPVGEKTNKKMMKEITLGERLYPGFWMGWGFVG